MPNARLSTLRLPASRTNEDWGFSFRGSFYDYGCPCPENEAAAYRCLCRSGDATDLSTGTWIHGDEICLDGHARPPLRQIDLRRNHDPFLLDRDTHMYGSDAHVQINFPELLRETADTV